MGGGGMGTQTGNKYDLKKFQSILNPLKKYAHVHINLSKSDCLLRNSVCLEIFYIQVVY